MGDAWDGGAAGSETSRWSFFLWERIRTGVTGRSPLRIIIVLFIYNSKINKRLSKYQMNVSRPIGYAVALLAYHMDAPRLLT